MDFTTLKALVASYLHRDDLSDVLDSLIVIVEDTLNQAVTAQEMIQKTTLALSGDSIPLPLDFIRIESLSIAVNSGRRVLSSVSIDQLQETGSGALTAYAVVGLNLQFNTEVDPADPVDIDIYYLARPVSLITAPSSAMLTAYPLLYLAGLMAEANKYVEDSDQYQTWTLTLNEHIAKVNAVNSTRMYKLPRTK